jgi:hypothetical protein
MVIDTQCEPELLPAFCAVQARDRASKWANPLAGEARYALTCADNTGDMDDFDEEDFDDEFDDDFEEELEDEYELSEFEDVSDEDLIEEDDDLGVLGGDFVDEDAEPEEAPAEEGPAAADADEPPAKGKKKKKPAKSEEDELGDED